jgi:glycosyltransferase involved in cell wall biosynthesis
MKVLNVNTHLDPVTGGGTAERTFQMSRYLMKSRIRCSILTTSYRLTEDHQNELRGVDLVLLPCVIPRFFIPKVNLGKIRKAVETADIIHLMGHWSILNAIVFLYAHWLNKPYVVCPAGQLRIYGRSKYLKKIFNKIIGRKIVLNATAHIAISSDELPQFELMGVTSKQVTLIPNGINRKDYLDKNVGDFRNKYNIGKNPFILYMGRLNYFKGVDLLLKAFCELKTEIKHYHLVFAGPNEDMLDKLIEIARQNNMQNRVHFIDHISGATKSQAYHGCDLLVIPSRHDAMSIVVLEAGITATPVLLTNQCGFNELEKIQGGKVVGASVEGIVNGLLEFKNNPEKFKLMGQNLFDYTMHNYTWELIVNNFVFLYRRILNENKGDL